MEYWFSVCSLLTILYCLVLGMHSGLDAATIPTFGNETDRLALLDFRSRITDDPLQIMSSWNDSLPFCNWTGITCNPSNGRVMILDLRSQKLVGSVPPSVGNLTFLTGLNLRNNSFHGEIPQDIGRLLQLRHLNFTYNSFGGYIPTNLTHCTQLVILDVVYNDLMGTIPVQLSSLSKLFYLGVRGNKLTGSIPAWIGNITSLHYLSLSENNLQGGIPHELGRLSNMERLELNANELSGIVPLSIYNISSIYYITVAQNQLHGQIPPDVGLTLPNLEIFGGALNRFSGPIPASFSNASKLWLLDIADNRLTGTVPTNLGNLPGLLRINFDDNLLGDGEVGNLNFLASLANCTVLEVLGLARNFFGGELPYSVANLSTNLRILTLGGNLLHGNVPIGIGKLVSLTLLGLEMNNFTGRVPDDLGRLQLLQGLYLNINKFSGPIPSSFGNLISLTRLFMEENRLEGSIPPSLGNCERLLVLNLSSNRLSGTIPKEIVRLSSLSISLAMGNNLLTGSIPFEVNNLVNLKELYISDNKLSGEIPSTLGACLSLEVLLMGGNLLQGSIPKSLETLKGLEEMDFSRNNLSGQLPEFLGKFSGLKKLNLSFNNFEGEVPSEGIFLNASAVSVIRNVKLCGGVKDLHLIKCSQNNSNWSKKFLAPRIVIPVTISVILVALFSCSFFAWYLSSKLRRKPLASSSNEESLLHISYSELVRATNGFSEDNLVGSGSFGSVYKGVLHGDGGLVAVKVLNLQQQGAPKSFMDECKALKNIRHRNLLKIIASCSSIDYQGNDFKCLVFEFMNNGNLDQWLHPRDGGQYQTGRLSIVQRLDIAIDVAFALDYLHHDCETPIVHCDLKPSNILLDNDMTAHVGDFGLAKFLVHSSDSPSKSQTISVGLKGSIGYIPPEYGMGGEVSTLGDVYSYGILLLEMFMGKRPTDELFRDGLSIHRFTEMAMPDHAMDIVDPSLMFAEEQQNMDEDEGEDKVEEGAIISNYGFQMKDTGSTMECLISVMRIGLVCSSSSPGERMPINIVANKLRAVRNLFVASEMKIRRK